MAGRVLHTSRDQLTLSQIHKAGTDTLNRKTPDPSDVLYAHCDVQNNPNNVAQPQTNMEPQNGAYID